MSKNQMRDLTGMKFGKLEAVVFVGKNSHRQSVWKFKCECGTEKELTAYNVTTGSTTSCGCHNIKKIKERFTKHGNKSNGKVTGAYTSWSSMIQRCTNPNVDKYEYYGGRGITVCDSWMDFNNFLKDMGERPQGRYSLDRIDPEGNYEPSNCRWATKEQQSRNIRILKNSESGVLGVTKNKKLNKWQARLHCNGKDYHLGLFENIEDAIKARKDAELKYYTTP